jgi:chromate transporter
VCVLIFNAVVKLWKSAVQGKAALLLFLGVTAGSLLLDVSPTVFVVLSAAAGIVPEWIRAMREKGGRAQ